MPVRRLLFPFYILAVFRLVWIVLVCGPKIRPRPIHATPFHYPRLRTLPILPYFMHTDLVVVDTLN
jgi:hypothetical protein